MLEKEEIVANDRKWIVK